MRQLDRAGKVTGGQSQQRTECTECGVDNATDGSVVER